MGLTSAEGQKPEHFKYKKTNNIFTSTINNRRASILSHTDSLCVSSTISKVL
jgi:hypothetical protein